MINRTPEIARPSGDHPELQANDPYQVAMSGLKTVRDQAENVVTRFPATTLVAALAVGVVAGCLIKRT